MSQTSILFIVIFALVACGNCLSSYPNNEINQNDIYEPRNAELTELEDSNAPSERFLFGTGGDLLGLGSSTGTTSVTIGNAGYLVLGAYILIPLIIGLALLFYLIGGHGMDRHGGYQAPVHDHYGSTGSSYGSLARFVLKKVFPLISSL